jgi:hypothetical protein
MIAICSTALQCGATRFFERTESLYCRSTLRPKGFNPRSRFSVAPHCNAVLQDFLNELSLCIPAVRCGLKDLIQQTPDSVAPHCNAMIQDLI